MDEAKQWTNKKEMNIVGHLSELRNRIIVTLLFFSLFFTAGFLYVRDIYAFFINAINIELVVISPGEIIWVYFSMAGIVAITGILPILAYQIWAFIKPGLAPNERRVSLAYIPFIFLLFMAGLVFGYLIFIKFLFPFLLSLNDGMFDVMLTVDRYFKFLFRTVVPFAILFELPIIAMFLTSLGIITPAFMRRTRKYAYFILIVLSAMLTPPDLVLPLLIAIPLIILYEISIHLSGMVHRKNLQKHEEFMEQEIV
ncbi:twin-arginine translocase subunit TatC [Lentibacillus jeotgali]|uniref:twin-arginine translocase subunit TatC n=1 Tax=Lentibacillus jeotgali TaxID=558169 RepID=UPI000262843F|nr:twin-arginine translocase subunit TatC [Lentibacillus jeotgali]